ncbi:MAG: RNA pseudouridine synthase, partial [Oscillospiraceae bacterium]
LINRCLHYLYDKGEYFPDNELSFAPSLCNRIDRNTSGIVIVAKNAEALRIMNEKIKNREVKKYYLCVVSGIVNPPKATLTHFLQRNENDSTVRIYDKPSSDTKTIVTSYQVLKTSRKNSLLEVELKTGRTHQIRAHMAYIHHPIIGDGKYGLNRVNKEYNEKHQLLCSYKLRFEFDDCYHQLGYLDSQEFEVNDVWFAKEFEEKF